MELMSMSNINRELQKPITQQELASGIKLNRLNKITKELDDYQKNLKFDINSEIQKWLDTPSKNRKPKSKHTIIAYKSNIQILVHYLETERLAITKLDYSHADEIMTIICNKYSSQNTQRQCLSSISAFFSYIERKKIVTQNPFKNIPIPQRIIKHGINPDTGKRVPVIQPDEVIMFLKEAEEKITNPHHRINKENAKNLYVSILLMQHLGLRAGSIPTVAFYKEDINNRWCYRCKQKGDTWHTGVLPDDLIDILYSKDLFDETPVTDACTYLTVMHGVENIAIKLMNKGEILYKFTPHDFRHYFANTLYKNTKDVVLVSRALGHSSIAMTDTYLKDIGLV